MLALYIIIDACAEIKTSATLENMLEVSGSWRLGRKTENMAKYIIILPLTHYAKCNSFKGSKVSWVLKFE